MRLTESKYHLEILKAKVYNRFSFVHPRSSTYRNRSGPPANPVSNQKKDDNLPRYIVSLVVCSFGIKTFYNTSGNLHQLQERANLDHKADLKHRNQQSYRHQCLKLWSRYPLLSFLNVAGNEEDVGSVLGQCPRCFLSKALRSTCYNCDFPGQIWKLVLIPRVQKGEVIQQRSHRGSPASCT
jgi:hypothetical protein